jgi:hypothetical protein
MVLVAPSSNINGEGTFDDSGTNKVTLQHALTTTTFKTDICAQNYRLHTSSSVSFLLGTVNNTIQTAHDNTPTMSRRPNPAADRAEQNRATLKNLVKLEGNKTCSDCKRNKRM